MQKNKLINAIQKYHLAGNCNSVKWEISNNSMNVKFMHENKTLLGNLEVSNIGLKDGEFGIYDTDQLLKMLSPLDSEIEQSYTEGFNGVDGMIISDSSLKAHYLFADLTVIPEVSELKFTPEPNLIINIDREFIDKFVKAKSALTDSNIFAIMAESNSVKLVVNYSTHRTNRMEIQLTNYQLVDPMDIIAFNSDLVKEVLVANKDCKTGTLKVSSEGLMTAEFSGDEYSSKYFIVKMDI